MLDCSLVAAFTEIFAVSDIEVLTGVCAHLHARCIDDRAEALAGGNAVVDRTSMWYELGN